MIDSNAEAPALTPDRSSPGAILFGLYLFGIGFGFVEAAVVVDLRSILSPAVARIAGRSSDELFPIIPFDQLEAADPAVARIMTVEVLREAATLAMLAGVGVATGRSFLGRFAAFVVAFGVWDLAYYGFLRLLIGWPTSVWTWDLLFLIPVPWAAPVLAPGVVAASMIVSGSFLIVRSAAGRPLRVSGSDWLAIVAGGLILIASFCWDWHHIQSGGTPGPFPWPLFLAGEAIGLAGFVKSCFAARRPSRAHADAAAS